MDLLDFGPGYIVFALLAIAAVCIILTAIFKGD